jgi:hypothetical protein
VLLLLLLLLLLLMLLLLSLSAVCSLPGVPVAQFVVLAPFSVLLDFSRLGGVPHGTHGRGWFVFFTLLEVVAKVRRPQHPAYAVGNRAIMTAAAVVETPCSRQHSPEQQRAAGRRQLPPSRVAAASSMILPLQHHRAL